MIVKVCILEEFKQGTKHKNGHSIFDFVFYGRIENILYISGFRPPF